MSNYFNPIESRILHHHPKLIYHVFDWIGTKEVDLIYRLSRDKRSIIDFVFNDDNDHIAKLIFLFRSSSTNFVFGTYVTTNLKRSTKQTIVLDNDNDNDPSFLFTLLNPHLIPPTRYFLRFSKIFSLSENDLYFGIGDRCNYDFHLSFSSLKVHFLFPKYFEDSTAKGSVTFTGSQSSKIDEIEIFRVHEKLDHHHHHHHHHDAHHPFFQNMMIDANND